MKIMANINLYSGLKDPEMEFNDETFKKVNDMLY